MMSYFKSGDGRVASVEGLVWLQPKEETMWFLFKDD